MNITIVGTGYVGLVTGACFAEMGHRVVCYDLDEAKIQSLRAGALPIYEPGLDDLIRRNTRQERLYFETGDDTALRTVRADLIFIAVGTPPLRDGRADISAVLDVAKRIAAFPEADRPDALVIKSTVPVGTADCVRDIFPGPVVSNPEFLKEGDAIDDCMKPPRVVLGRAEKDAGLDPMFQRLYESFTRGVGQILFMDNRSAELVKHASNAMLATRIAFMNDMANLCESVHADIDHVRAGVGSDPRIGPKFLFAGPGYGGSCFPKDIAALLANAADYHCKLSVATAVHSSNRTRIRQLLWDKCEALVLQQRTNDSPCILAVLGLAFKPGTDDMRESAAIPLIESAERAGWIVRVTDPEARPKDRSVLPSMYHAAEGADVLCLATDWNQYKSPDWRTLRDVMRGNAIVDGRNLWDPRELVALGFRYTGIGRGLID